MPGHRASGRGRSPCSSADSAGSRQRSTALQADALAAFDLHAQLQPFQPVQGNRGLKALWRDHGGVSGSSDRAHTWMCAFTGTCTHGQEATGLSVGRSVHAEFLPVRAAGKSVPDHRFDPRLRGHPLQGVVLSSHSVPLLDEYTGELWGSLSHFDMKNSPLSDAEFDLLQGAAQLLPAFMAKI